VLDIHGLHVDAFDNGLGFAWTSASTKPTPTPKIIQEISIPEGTSDVLLRALVGKNVAALHIRVVQAGSELKTTEINRPGFERFEWVQVANSVSSIGGPLLLEIGASKGFAAANGSAGSVGYPSSVGTALGCAAPKYSAASGNNRISFANNEGPPPLERGARGFKLSAEAIHFIYTKKFFENLISLFTYPQS